MRNFNIANQNLVFKIYLKYIHTQISKAMSTAKMISFLFGLSFKIKNETKRVIHIPKKPSIKEKITHKSLIKNKEINQPALPIRLAHHLLAKKVLGIFLTFDRVESNINTINQTNKNNILLLTKKVALDTCKRI